MTDPSQPQNYLGGPPWMSTADLAAVGYHAQHKDQSAEPAPPPDPRALRRKWRARRIRTIAFTIAAFAFIVGAVLDYANGRHNPAGPLVMTGIFAFFAVHQWRRARQTMAILDSLGAAPLI